MSFHCLLGRDREFGNRKKRFLKAFPDCEFTKITIPMGGDTTEEFKTTAYDEALMDNERNEVEFILNETGDNKVVDIENIRE